MPSQDLNFFGWQGFGFPTPPDYAPLTLSGTRREGYARLGSSGRLNIQVRWRMAQGKVNLKSALETYLDKLKRDSKKAKEQFKSELDEKDDAIYYRYLGAGQGRGKLFVSPDSQRLFFIEVVGARKDQCLPAFRIVDAGFKDFEKEEWEVWSMLGLKFRTPYPMTLEKKTMQAGRSELVLKSRWLRIEVNRWGFGEQLIKKHGFAEWSVAALNMKYLPDQEDENRLEYEASGLIRPISALAQYDPENNQITTIKAYTRSTKRRPTWDWLSF